MKRTKTVWKVRIPPTSEVVLRDGTIIKNTDDKKSACLKIEMKIIPSQSVEENSNDIPQEY